MTDSAKLVLLGFAGAAAIDAVVYGPLLALFFLARARKRAKIRARIQKIRHMPNAGAEFRQRSEEARQRRDGEILPIGGWTTIV